MKDNFNFPLDHFGVVLDPLYRRMLTQDSNKRARRVAFNAIVRVAKASKQIPANGKVVHIGTSCDEGGQIWLTFIMEEEPSEPAIK